MSNGRIGMATVRSHTEPEDFDLVGFGLLLSTSLQAYALPRFLHLKTAFDMTPTHKIKKVDLRENGFDLAKIDCHLKISIVANS